MTHHVLFLILTALLSQGIGNYIDCFDELRERQLDEKYRDILIAALRADNAWMSYDCTFEKYARWVLRNKQFKVPPDVNFTMRYMRDGIKSVERFLKDGVEKFKLRKIKFIDIGCYYIGKKNKHNIMKHKVFVIDINKNTKKLETFGSSEKLGPRYSSQPTSSSKKATSAHDVSAVESNMYHEIDSFLVPPVVDLRIATLV